MANTQFWIGCGVAAVVYFSAPATKVFAAPRVPGFERFHAVDDTASVEAGRLLVQELNCLACHRGPSDLTAVAPKKAPVLDDIGSRVRPEWLQGYLTDPQQVKPGTTMPHVMETVPAADRAAAIEALTHFLASTGNVADTHPDQSAAQKGKATFHRVGCTACHNAVGDNVIDIPTSVALPDLGKKYTSTSLAAFLKDPLKSRPSGRMPAFGLKDEDYRNIAQFFVRDVQLSPNVEYAVYQGSWEKLPDFDTLKPVKTGQCAGFDLTVAERTNDFAIRFQSNLYVKAPAQHQFYLGSDDGSRLTIGGEVIVDSDGIHPHTENKGRHSFEVGWHPVIVDYFQGGGEWTLDVDIDGNGLKRQPLAGLVSLTKEPPQKEQAAFQVDAALAEKGREWFQSVGCASCHTLKQDGKALAATKTAKPWSELRSKTGGCLAEAPPTMVPHYRFSAKQRAALAAVIGMATTPSTLAEVVHHTFVAFNCYACHKRGEIGGVEEARDALFTSAQKEMGDEGRLPPALTGVGDKLQEAWTKHVLEQGANDRQLYMQAKMPKFGGGNVGHLVATLAAVDRQPETAPNPMINMPKYKVAAVGRHLVGANALSCIKCHDFSTHPSQGVRAINLTTMTKRLREDWFHRYMLDPQAFRPGTRMPAPWPFGTSSIRDLLDGSADKQIRAVWQYLEAGERAPVPVGLVREPIELKPSATPILYRNFIEGAGARAIGVGYPEHASLAWDANDMRLAMIWHGAFIDASRHWNGRGVGFESPLGDDLLQLPGGQPLAQLDSINANWPDGSARDNGFRFRGYQLDADQRPTFRYEGPGITIDDFPKPVLAAGVKSAHLERTLKISGASGGTTWYFRAAIAETIDAADGGYRIDNLWVLKVTSGETPVIRDSRGKKELLVPIKLAGQPVSVTLHYEW